MGKSKPSHSRHPHESQTGLDGIRPPATEKNQYYVHVKEDTNYDDTVQPAYVNVSGDSHYQDVVEGNQDDGQDIYDPVEVRKTPEKPKKVREPTLPTLPFRKSDCTETRFSKFSQRFFERCPCCRGRRGIESGGGATESGSEEKPPCGHAFVRKLDQFPCAIVPWWGWLAIIIVLLIIIIAVSAHKYGTYNA